MKEAETIALRDTQVKVIDIVKLTFAFSEQALFGRAGILNYS